MAELAIRIGVGHCGVDRARAVSVVQRCSVVWFASRNVGVSVEDSGGAALGIATNGSGPCLPLTGGHV